MLLRKDNVRIDLKEMFYECDNSFVTYCLHHQCDEKDDGSGFH